MSGRGGEGWFRQTSFLPALTLAAPRQIRRRRVVGRRPTMGEELNFPATRAPISGDTRVKSYLAASALAAAEAKQVTRALFLRF